MTHVAVLWRAPRRAARTIHAAAAGIARRTVTIGHATTRTAVRTARTAAAVVTDGRGGPGDPPAWPILAIYAGMLAAGATIIAAVTR